jgi:hypothetical protein
MMGDVLPFLTMSEIEAARLREATLGEADRLEPRRIAGGARAGRYALPRRVMFDEAFVTHRDAFALMTEVALDPAEAWPPAPDGEEAG